MIHNIDMMRPQDVLVLGKLALIDTPWRQLDLALALGLSQPELSLSLRRSAAAELYNPDTKRVLKRAYLEFVVHGLRYVFPAERGAPARGVPTAWAVAPLAQRMHRVQGDLLVWPHAGGDVRGPSLRPVYKTIPDAAMRDPKLHQLFALIDAIRAGKAREREVASEVLRSMLA